MDTTILANEQRTLGETEAKEGVTRTKSFKSIRGNAGLEETMDQEDEESQKQG